MTCRAVGIGSYLVRLGQRVIQVENAHLILTGAPALNKVNSIMHVLLNGLLSLLSCIILAKKLFQKSMKLDDERSLKNAFLPSFISIVISFASGSWPPSVHVKPSAGRTSDHA